MKRRSKVRATSAKTRRPKSARLRRQSEPKNATHLASSAAGEKSKIARLSRELNEAREQQTAASEVLQAISSSQGDVQPVFAAMLEKAVRICDATFGNIYRRDGEALQLVATHNTPPCICRISQAYLSRYWTCYQSHGDGQIGCSRGRHGRGAGLCQTRTDDGGSGRTWARSDVCRRPNAKGERIDWRAHLVPPVRPFTDKQIELVKNFAAQAVIAIENARLLSELRQRTDDLSQRTTDLTDALEQQMATSEVLQVISRSPGDLEPVFASMLENAVRICDADFGKIYRWNGDALHLIATRNTPPASRKRAGIHSPGLRRFLSPQVADLIVASGTEKELESHRREITALFCVPFERAVVFDDDFADGCMIVAQQSHHDLRGFTGFTESADAEDAGDGVMVVFNDPVPVENPALQAVLMALELREAIGALTATWSRLGHEIGFGIGIAHGFATLGTIGFEGRFDYAAIGTVSNVASRLCDEAKPGQILISPRVLMKVENAVKVEPVGEFVLKGIRRPLAAYNVVSLIA
jgi:hypothetical protein